MSFRKRRPITAHFLWKVHGPLRNLVQKRGCKTLEKILQKGKAPRFIRTNSSDFLMRITCFHARDYHQNLIGKITTEVKFAEQKSALLQKGFLLRHTALLLPNLKNTLR